MPSNFGLRALQALSVTLNFKSIIKRVCNYICNLTLPWRQKVRAEALKYNNLLSQLLCRSIISDHFADTPFPKFFFKFNRGIFNFLTCMATCSCFILPHQVRPNKKYFPSYSDDTRKTETKDNYYAFLLLLRGYL